MDGSAAGRIGRVDRSLDRRRIVGHPVARSPEEPDIVPGAAADLAAALVEDQAIF